MNVHDQSCPGTRRSAFWRWHRLWGRDGALRRPRRVQQRRNEWLKSRVAALFALLCLLSFSSEAEAGLKIYFIRHAEYGHNVVAEWRNVPRDQWPAYVGNGNMITPKGEAQLGPATEKLKQHHYDFIAVSPYLRTRHTVLPYLKATDAKGEIWPELGEFGFLPRATLCHQPAAAGRRHLQRGRGHRITGR